MVDFSETVSENPSAAMSPMEANRFENGELVKGRVFLYDDMTKTLILKLWSDQEQMYTGLGLYNARNVKLERIHVLQDVDDSDDSLQ